MAIYTVRLQDVRGEAFPLVGRKALGLAELRRAGFSVPEGFCVTTEAFRRVKASLGESGAVSSGVRERIAGLSLPGDMLREIGDLYEKMFVGRPVAVRSSGILEDLPEASFAGQYETFLNVVYRCGRALLSPIVGAPAPEVPLRFFNAQFYLEEIPIHVRLGELFANGRLRPEADI